jgi:hypothetical protein
MGRLVIEPCGASLDHGTVWALLGAVVADRPDVKVDASVATASITAQDGMSGLGDWEDEAGKLTPEERAAGEDLRDQLLLGPPRRPRRA